KPGYYAGVDKGVNGGQPGAAVFRRPGDPAEAVLVPGPLPVPGGPHVALLDVRRVRAEAGHRVVALAPAELGAPIRPGGVRLEELTRLPGEALHVVKHRDPSRVLRWTGSSPRTRRGRRTGGRSRRPASRAPGVLPRFPVAVAPAHGS